MNKSAQEVERTTINLLDSIKEKVHTVTSDNGKEFAKHESIAKNLDAHFFFAHPYASWERGLNENTNGLIRQYFSKKNFNHISDQQVQSVMEKLNNRPRKCLGMKTPNQVFFKDHSFVALQSWIRVKFQWTNRTIYKTRVDKKKNLTRMIVCVEKLVNPGLSLFHN